MTLAQLDEELQARNLNYVSMVRLRRPTTVVVEARYFSGGTITASGEDIESAVLELLAMIPRRHPVPVPSKDIIP